MLLFIVADNCSSYHHLFLIFPHLQWYYAQYYSLFSVNLILIHGHLMTIKMVLEIIILPVS